VNYWEIIADNLRKRGWSLGCVSAVDSEGRTIWIVDAHRDDGKRFVVHADEILTAFLELESAICACGEFTCHAGELFSKLGGVKKSESGGGLSPARFFRLLHTCNRRINRRETEKEERKTKTIRVGVLLIALACYPRLCHFWRRQPKA